jgi:quinol monooxygenase YgiN
MTTATSPVHVVATLLAQPGKVDALAAVLGELARTGRDQPGNRRFEVHQQASDALQLITIEQWDGVAAADAHMTSEYVAAALGKLGPLLAAPPQIVRYTQVA